MLRSLNYVLFAATVCGSIVPTSPAQAQEAMDLSAEVSVVSDYRFRGVSLSGRDPAMQAEISLEHESGVYASVWGSTIAETAGGADVEVDWLVGYAVDLSDRLSLDAAAILYTYPGDSGSHYAEGFLTATYSVGFIAPYVGVAYAPKQDNLRDENGSRRDNVYAFAGVDADIPETPIKLHGTVGYESGLLDWADSGGKWDWRVGASVSLDRLELGLAYTDSDVDVIDGVNALADATVVASMAVSF